MIKESIKLLTQNVHLSEDQMVEAMNDIMSGQATDAQTASFLTALRMKGETIEEITGAARVMRGKATKINSPENTVDTCGTGGDMACTFNISTTAAIIVSACGVPVAKHGNRSVSSSCGSADILERLDVKIDLKPEKVEKCLEETGFGFMFAPLFHPAIKHAIGPRKEMGIRTIFNILGPLTNPAGAKRQVLGVFSDDLTETMAQVLLKLETVHAFVVHSEDGLDEISNTGRTKVSELKDDKVSTYFMTPEEFGFSRATIEDLKGENAFENARITIAILKGEKGPKRDITVLNAAAALIAGNEAGDFKGSAEKVSEAIDSGRAMKKLEEIKEVSNKL
jgi:anthranilate phosphoribosyltransferase